MTNTLFTICAEKRSHINTQKQIVPEAELLAVCKTAEAPRRFIDNLRAKISTGKPALIAEIKKASPSKGVIREDFNPELIARSYAEAGACCLSVLTDMPYFQGRDEYLLIARNATLLPILRKDFMLDPYQIIESRAIGADAVLLIMAALENSQAQELEKAAHELKMDVLIEVHDEAELERALTYLSSTLIGINNRNLKTLQVNLATAEMLANKIPTDKIAVCESGISNFADIGRMRRSGLHVFLVGESLMREHDITAATRRLLGNGY